MRPSRIVVVTGTGTEVGKTWVAAALVAHLRRLGVTVAARKPAQSYQPTSAGRTDAEVLAAASGEAVGTVCRPERCYPRPLAPPMAAAALGLPAFDLDDLERELGASWPAGGVDVGVVEGAGGVASPLCADGDTADLARRLGADVVVLVAGAELGTINLVRLSRRALDPLPTIVVLNRYQPGCDLHVLNHRWLAERDRVTVATDIGALATLVEAALPRC